MAIDEVVGRIGEARAVAIVRAPTREQAEVAMAAAFDAGFRVGEFTLSVPDALSLVRAFREPGRTIGVGTVLTPAELDAALAAGAEFAVSPVLDPDLVRRATASGAPMLPGCATPTELLAARRAGAPIQKLFPAPGPDFVRTVLAPLPSLRILPTSGVDLDNAAAYLEAGAFALGFVRSLFEPRWLAARDAPAIRERASALLEVVRRAPR